VCRVWHDPEEPNAELLRSADLRWLRTKGHDRLVFTLMDSPKLNSQRLILRSPHKDDAEGIQRLANDREVAMGLARVPYPYTLKDALFFLDKIVPKEFAWIVQHASSERMLGVIGLTPYKDADNIELGFWLGREFWGRGFATEAAKVVLDYAFSSNCTSVVTAGCFIDNFRSLRVLTKLGFQITGESLRLGLAKGSELPHYEMLLTREMWDH
jgi:RimJ/RimL family protein N-acetyltransferase